MVYMTVAWINSAVYGLYPPVCSAFSHSLDKEVVISFHYLRLKKRDHELGFIIPKTNIDGLLAAHLEIEGEILLPFCTNVDDLRVVVAC